MEPLIYLREDETNVIIRVNPNTKLAYIISEIPPPENNPDGANRSRFESESNDKRSMIRVYSTETNQNETTVVINISGIVGIQFLPDNQYAYLISLEKRRRKTIIYNHYINLKTFQIEYCFHHDDYANVIVSPFGNYYVLYDEMWLKIHKVSDNSLVYEYSGLYYNDVYWKYDEKEIIEEEGGEIERFSLENQTWKTVEKPLVELNDDKEQELSSAELVNIRCHPTFDCIIYTMRTVGDFTTLIGKKWNGELLFRHLIPYHTEAYYNNFSFNRNFLLIEWRHEEYRTDYLDVYDCSTGQLVADQLPGIYDSDHYKHHSENYNYAFRFSQNRHQPNEIEVWDFKSNNPKEWKLVKTISKDQKIYCKDLVLADLGTSFKVFHYNTITNTIDVI